MPTQPLQMVKDFSPFGWGITIIALILQFYTDNKPNNSAERQEIADLRAEIKVLSTDMYNVKEVIKDNSYSLAQLKRISCSSLTTAQKQLVQC